jgi:2-polyprenyl-3-methyl-5-hydroxy-6-metoxy-1,4-benzoquinol methylase
MINTKIFLEKFLQNQRFKIINKSFLKGSVLDFGGNEGELKAFVKGEYTLVNYDHSPMWGKLFDNIIALAVIEHMEIIQVFDIFNKFRNQIAPEGNIVVTTPTPMSKPILEILASIGLLEKENILEHKHYWIKSELENLGKETGFKLISYKKFQFGFNQMAIFQCI